MRIAAALVVIAFALVAASVTSTAGAAPPGCKSPAKWRGVHAVNYNVGCEVCREYGVKAVAREYGVRSRDPVVVARRFATVSARPAFRQAHFEGCLRGFRLRG